MNRHRLLQRFLRYVKIDTTARPEATVYPSSPGQLRLGRLLRKELQAMGLTEAVQDRYGIVSATIPASPAAAGEAIAFCAHMDTSPETTGKGVQPQVLKNYQGGDLVLPGDPQQIIRVADNPELAALHGGTLITTDGTTLLGADDKAGVAIIMETAAWLMEHPELPRPPVRLLFTCDEEIGRGVDYIDPREVAAAACYTLDGQGAALIDVETFSADVALVAIHGVNIHPSIAKGRMTNAIRVAADFLGRLPQDELSPETTEGRQGFLHPYEISGGVAEVSLRIILRDFDAARLEHLGQLLSRAAAASVEDFPAAKIEVSVKRQYRNLAEGLAREPRAVGHAQEALRRLGGEAKLAIVRGGTDGSRLTELGLPTPNLSCGGHTPHSPLEWACLDEMVRNAQWLVALAEVWAG